MQNRLRIGTGLGLGAALGMAATADASTVTVTNLNDSGPGSLRQAINDVHASPEGDTILFQSGLSGQITLGSALPILTQPTEIVGPGPNKVTVSGNHATNILDIDLVTSFQPVSISGLRFADAKSNNDGAAIYNYDSDLTLTNMAFTGNASTTGADDGGAISDIFGNLTIRFTTLSGNAAADEGGAIDVYSPHGGGPGQVLIDHSTITGNASTVGGAGGGIFQYADSLVITNSTIAGNHADAVAGQGGGIDVIYTDPQLTNTIVADNTAPAFPDIYGYSNQGNFTGTLSLVENLGGETLGGTGNLTGVDPKLGPLADNGGPTQTLALQAGSPAIDKGVDSGTDQRGAPRPFDQQGASNAPGGNAADIGAYERVLCANVPVNKIGTGGKDNLIGTAGIDGILGLGGKDTLKGLAGNDALCGGPGKDKLKGGAGADKLRGEGGADTLIGGKGKDVLKGGPGKDKQTQ